MASITMKTQAGKNAGKADLVAGVFGIEPNMSVMHQVVTAQLAAKRAGTHSTKTRREVAGGGAKPWRQKGTGRARAGTIRAPHWRGGGVAHGPKPRSYSQRTPKKMIKLALNSALSDRASDDNVIVVDQWSFDTPKTAAAKAALVAIGAEGKVLMVLGDEDTNAFKSFRNLTNVHCLSVRELNTYDVLDSDVVVFTQATLPAAAPVAAVAKPPAKPAPTAPVAAVAKPAKPAPTAPVAAVAKPPAKPAPTAPVAAVAKPAPTAEVSGTDEEE